MFRRNTYNVVVCLTINKLGNYEWRYMFTNRAGVAILRVNYHELMINDHDRM